MADFQIVLSGIRDIEPSTLAENLLARYGDDYDAARGDFTVNVTDPDTLVVSVKDVTGWDIDMLAEDIERDEGGTFKIHVTQRVEGSFYGRDPGDDVIE
jgi:hypothetical protein